MTIDSVIMLLGALVALLPYLGFPNDIDKLIFLALGFLIVALGVVLRRRTPARPRRESLHFVENEPHRTAADDMHDVV